MKNLKELKSKWNEFWLFKQYRHWFGIGWISNKYSYWTRRLFYPTTHVIIKHKEVDSGLWMDKDHLLLHVSFQLLVDYVEEEKPNEICDWTWDEAHRNAWTEISELYNWWTIVRPMRVDPLDSVEFPFKKNLDNWLDNLNNPPDTKEHRDWHEACMKSGEKEKEWDDEDTEMLCKLMRVRGFLWT